jgi:hypothetical protein
MLENQEKFVCSVCCKEFKNKRALTTHTTYHGDRTPQKRNPQTKETIKKIKDALTGRKLKGTQLANLLAYHKTRRIPKEVRTCKLCGTTFECAVNSVQEFCSKSCGCTFKAKRVNRESRYCLQCGKKFRDRVTGTKKFCGHVCSTINARSHMLETPTKETREKISTTLSKTYMDGRFNPQCFYKSGTITLNRLNLTLHYRSSYEEKALLLLDTLVDVSDVKGEALSIAYLDKEGCRHYYLPDYLVTTYDNSKYVIEVKPDNFVDSDDNVRKFNAAITYCQQNNMVFLVWTEGILFNNNGSTTASLQEIVKATATTFNTKVMVQSDLCSNAEKGAEMTPSPDKESGLQVTECWKKHQFLDRIEEGNNNIIEATLRAMATFIVAGSNVMRVIRQLPNFKAANTGKTPPTGPYKAGTLDGRTVIHDPFMKDVYINNTLVRGTNRYILGYKGDNILMSGFIHAPYIPLFSTATLTTSDLIAQKGFYAASGFKTVNAGMFTYGKISGL